MNNEEHAETGEETVRTVELPDMDNATASDTAPAWVDRNMDLIRGVRVRLDARIGQAELTVDQLFGLREGETLPLSDGGPAAVELMLDGQVVARGELVVVGDRFGVRIAELPERG